MLGYVVLCKLVLLYAAAQPPRQPDSPLRGSPELSDARSNSSSLFVPAALFPTAPFADATANLQTNSSQTNILRVETPGALHVF